MQSQTKPIVLIIDPDRDICELVRWILSDAGFDASCLCEVNENEIRAAAARVEPDCILLDSNDTFEYGSSWEAAGGLRARGRPVPVIMFTAHAAAAREARLAESERALAAGFSGVILKPFDIEDLLEAVAKAVGEAAPYDRSPQGDARRTQALVTRLRQAGARDIHRSTLREWVIFRNPGGRLVQLYWWQNQGLYCIGAYRDDDATLQLLGTSPSLDEAVTTALNA